VRRREGIFSFHASKKEGLINREGAYARRGRKGGLNALKRAHSGRKTRQKRKTSVASRERKTEEKENRGHGGRKKRGTSPISSSRISSSEGHLIGR